DSARAVEFFDQSGNSGKRKRRGFRPVGGGIGLARIEDDLSSAGDSVRTGRAAGFRNRDFGPGKDGFAGGGEGFGAGFGGGGKRAGRVVKNAGARGSGVAGGFGGAAAADLGDDRENPGRVGRSGSGLSGNAVE